MDQIPNAPDRDSLSRREALKIGVGAGLALTLDRLPAFAATAAAPAAPTATAAPAAAPEATRVSQAAPLLQRAIPSSGERVPIVGIGTARNYDNPSPELRSVLQRFPELGGKVLDTAPGYGRAEIVVGDFLAELKNRDRYFIATKVSVGGRRGGGGTREDAIAQMEESLRRFHTDRIDLMQIWNLSSPDLLLPLLDEWKAAKKIRYTGITTSSDGQYDALETLMKAHKFDFIQVDLAIDNRGSQDRLLPLAAERGMGVLINLPFGRTRVFQKVMGKPLPDWAREIDCTTWAQLFLKYIVGNPAVTCVIPGTEKVEFLVDNLGAARGRLPDAAMRKRIEEYFDAL